MIIANEFGRNYIYEGDPRFRGDDKRINGIPAFAGMTI